MTCVHIWLNQGATEQCLRCLSLRPRFPHPVLRLPASYAPLAA